MDHGWERASAPLGPPWPTRSLIFSCWEDDTQFYLMRNVLLSRDWHYMGAIADPHDYVNEMKELVSSSTNLPRRCLYICCDKTEINLLKKFSHSEPTGGRFRLTMFPGCEPACYKKSTAMHMARQYTGPMGCPFYPKTYVLPKASHCEQSHLLQGSANLVPDSPLTSLPSQDRPLLEALSREEPSTLWITKPHNGYGGKGVCAMKASDPGFKKAIAKGTALIH